MKGWRNRTLAATDFRDQDDLALGLELGQVGVLEDLAVDRRRHAFFDLAAKAWKSSIEFQNHPAEGVRLHLELGLSSSLIAVPAD